MRTEYKPFESWLGDWAGRGESRDMPTTTRVTIRPRMGGELLEFSVESLHAETNKLVHGVVAILAVDPDQQMRMAVTSTIHGTIVMPVTPEDPGALAIEGNSVTGNHVVVSMVEENGGLMLTSYWKKPEGGERVGFSNVRLTRVSPAV